MEEKHMEEITRTGQNSDPHYIIERKQNNIQNKFRNRI